LMGEKTTHNHTHTDTHGREFGAPPGASPAACWQSSCPTTWPPSLLAHPRTFAASYSAASGLILSVRRS
jgi:hypothetical protein